MILLWQNYFTIVLIDYYDIILPVNYMWLVVSLYVDVRKTVIELQFIWKMTRRPNDATIYFGVEIYDPEDEDII